MNIPSTIDGRTSVVVSDQLPITPSDGKIARRIVRHAMADVLTWLGEAPGPAPTARTHAVLIGSGVILISRDLCDRILRAELENRKMGLTQ